MTRIRAIADQTRELLTGSVAIGIVAALGVTSAVDAHSAGGAALGVGVAAATAWLIKRYWRWRSSVTRGHLTELLDIMKDSIAPK